MNRDKDGLSCAYSNSLCGIPNGCLGGALAEIGGGAGGSRKNGVCEETVGILDEVGVGMQGYGLTFAALPAGDEQAGKGDQDKLLFHCKVYLKF
jgi:hypothetical protein